MTFPVLHAICVRLQKGMFNASVDKMLETVFVVAFFGFLRCGEFTCRTNFDPNVNLCVGDVEVQDSQTVLLLKVSKTDFFRKSVHIRLFCNSKLLCPKCLLDKHVVSRHREGAMPMDPLFVLENGQPLKRVTFIKHLRQVLTLCGFDYHLYNGHSFRIGAATSAAEKHIEDHLIKTMGRWSSDAYCRYIRTSQDTLRAAQSSLSES